VIERVTNFTGTVMREQTIIGHNLRDSGISVLTIVYSRVVRYHSLIPL